MSSSSKKSKIRSIELEDNCGNVAHTYLHCRSVLRSIIHQIEMKEKELWEKCIDYEFEMQVTELQSQQTNEINDDNALPLSFGKKKKQKKNKHNNKELFDYETTKAQLRHYSDVSFGMLLEYNVYYLHPQHSKYISSSQVISTSSILYPEINLVKVIGVAPGKDLSRSLVRLIHTNELISVHRNTELVSIPSQDIPHIHSFIEQHVWNNFSYNKPSYLQEKYWNQRYRIFSKFDEGIRLDEESWYSVTYECIGLYCVDRIVKIFSSLGYGQCQTILDCFSGCGGCSIHFARRLMNVLAIDLDAEKLTSLMHNSNIYQVQDRIHCFAEDVYEVLASLIPQPTNNSNNTSSSPYLEYYQEYYQQQHYSLETQTKKYLDQTQTMIDVIVLSPPWGGPEYLNIEIFDLETMLPCGDGLYLTTLARMVCPFLVLIIPRNTSFDQIHALAEYLQLNYKFEKIKVSLKIKLVVVFFFPKTRKEIIL